jgi:hypothetical protein
MFHLIFLLSSLFLLISLFPTLPNQTTPLSRLHHFTLITLQPTKRRRQVNANPVLLVLVE